MAREIERNGLGFGVCVVVVSGKVLLSDFGESGDFKTIFQLHHRVQYLTTISLCQSQLSHI